MSIQRRLQALEAYVGSEIRVLDIEFAYADSDGRFCRWAYRGQWAFEDGFMFARRDRADDGTWTDWYPPE